MRSSFEGMTRFKTAIAIFLLAFGFVLNSSAGIRPSFYLENLAAQASDIVVVKQKWDGKCAVIETWKGELKSGDTIVIPDLTNFLSEESRTISYWPREANSNSPAQVTGSRISLFLKKSSDSIKWEPASNFDGMQVSMAWIENGQTYAFVQRMNPGPSLLVPLHLSESEMKTQVQDVVQTQATLATTIAITNLAQRADALKSFVSSKHWFARKVAFTELGKCGEAALPILRQMLNDESMLPQHGDVIGALGQAGGASVCPELTKLVETETQFWKQAAPNLKSGWWNGTGIDWSEVETLRNRYVKLLAAIRVLNGLRYDGCKVAVTQLRDFWRSLPQLEDKSGIDQMSQECDNLLKSLQ
jgi:hypothetical protein